MKPAETGRDLEPLPGQLLLPGMPDPDVDPSVGQAALPGLDDLRAPGRPATWNWPRWPPS